MPAGRQAGGDLNQNRPDKSIRPTILIFKFLNLYIFKFLNIHL